MFRVGCVSVHTNHIEPNTGSIAEHLLHQLLARPSLCSMQAVTVALGCNMSGLVSDVGMASRTARTKSFVLGWNGKGLGHQVMGVETSHVKWAAVQHELHRKPPVSLSTLKTESLKADSSAALHLCALHSHKVLPGFSFPKSLKAWAGCGAVAPAEC